MNKLPKASRPEQHRVQQQQINPDIAITTAKNPAVDRQLIACIDAPGDGQHWQAILCADATSKPQAAPYRALPSVIGKNEG